MFDVTCLGILVADAIVNPVDEFPEYGKLKPVDSLTLHVGGCAANASVDLSKIGVKTSIIGNVGEDGFGEFLKNRMFESGVDTKGLKVKKGVNTSASVVMVSQSSERSFFHCIGSNAELKYEDVDFDIIKKSRVLFVAGTNLMPGFDGEPCGRILKKAQEMGVYTALDTAWDATGRWMEIIRPCLPCLDLFIPSYDEAKMISGKSDPEDIADIFIQMGVKLAVIKMGKEGCFIKSSQGEKHVIPTYTRIRPVDTTGAGDSFAAGFITGIVKGWNLEMCGRFANAVGTHCVMKVGATTGIKPMDDIIKFMESYERSQVHDKAGT